jgi:hypothetical protein
LSPQTLAVGVPSPNWIEAMNERNAHLPRPVLEQVYLIERDTGLLCRILGLYASRGIDVQRADYAYAAPDVMTLKVAASIETANTAEALRVLVEKAATLVGVIAAAEQPPAAAAYASAQSTAAPRRRSRPRRMTSSAESARLPDRGRAVHAAAEIQETAD